MSGYISLDEEASQQEQRELQAQLAEAKRQGAVEVLDTMRDYCNQVINIDRDDPDSWYLKAFKSVSAKLDDIRARYETTGEK
jgi:hypothetical protein